MCYFDFCMEVMRVGLVFSFGWFIVGCLFYFLVVCFMTSDFKVYSFVLILVLFKFVGRVNLFLISR